TKQFLAQDRKQVEEPQLSSIIFLIIITGFISLSSEFLVNLFEEVVKILDLIFFLKNYNSSSLASFFIYNTDLGNIGLDYQPTNDNFGPEFEEAKKIIQAICEENQSNDKYNTETNNQNIDRRLKLQLITKEEIKENKLQFLKAKKIIQAIRDDIKRKNRLED
ncbi:6271_t:CDS:2, partial [Gigaspora margarita]